MNDNTKYLLVGALLGGLGVYLFQRQSEAVLLGRPVIPNIGPRPGSYAGPVVSFLPAGRRF